MARPLPSHPKLQITAAAKPAIMEAVLAVSFVVTASLLGFGRWIAALEQSSWIGVEPAVGSSVEFDLRDAAA